MCSVFGGVLDSRNVVSGRSVFMLPSLLTLRVSVGEEPGIVDVNI